jgi:hypothetical protein
MSPQAKFFVEPWDENSTPCDCCGKMSRVVWGGIATKKSTVAAYYVQWTVNAPQHDANIDLILGNMDDDSTPSERVLVSLLYRARPSGGVMVIDGTGRPVDDREICRQAMKRDEVIGTPLAADVFALVDAIWLQDPRIDELRAR